MAAYQQQCLVAVRCILWQNAQLQRQTFPQVTGADTWRVQMLQIFKCNVQVINIYFELWRQQGNKLFQILETLAKDDGYDYIFDKSGEILLLYANEKHDLTQKVLQRMQTFGK